MNSMIVTNGTGAKTKPIGMTIAPPDCEMNESELMIFASEAQSNSPLLANLVSAFTAHERCCVHLYRAAVGMTQFQEWRERYEGFLERAIEHVRILSELTDELGGNSKYVSPQARMTEFMNTKLMESILLSGSVDSLTLELTMLEVVLIARKKSQSNWELLDEFHSHLPNSSISEAIEATVKEVKTQEARHVQWAQRAWQQAILAQLAPGLADGRMSRRSLR